MVRAIVEHSAGRSRKRVHRRAPQLRLTTRIVTEPWFIGWRTTHSEELAADLERFRVGNIVQLGGVTRIVVARPI